MPGSLSESREIRVEFIDEAGDVLMEFTVLGRSLIVAGKGDTRWEAIWPEGLEWIEGKVNSKEEAGGELKARK